MTAGKAIEPVHQPAGRKNGRHGNGENIVVTVLRKRHCGRQRLKAFAKPHQHRDPSLRNYHALGSALE